MPRISLPNVVEHIYDNIEEINQDIATWKKAKADLATAQKVDMAGRTLTRADLPEINNVLIELGEAKKVFLNDCRRGPVIVPTRPTR